MFDKKMVAIVKWQRYPRWPPKEIFLNLRHISTKTAEILG
jgi:hypothetical protein